MKTLGLIGGMSWNSTELYYRLINQTIAREAGGLHSAKILLHSFDFAEIAALQKAEDWAGATKRMVEAALGLKRAGAEGIVICTNTMHRMAAEIEAATQLPLLHIIDVIAENLRQQGITKAGILGTYFTMTAPFYADYFKTRHGITLLAPDETTKQEIHRVIYDELCQGQVTDSARTYYLAAMRALESQGAEAIILGCTEIGMLLTQRDYSALPLLDSTALHAEAAAFFALS